MAASNTRRELKQDRALQTQADILNAAISLFARRGILSTTMADLARAIRMTPSALYWHFPNKEELVLAALEELHRRMVVGFSQGLVESKNSSAKEQLGAFLRHAQTLFQEHPDYGIFFGMLSAEAAENSEAVASALRERVSVYCGLLARIIAHGQHVTKELRNDADAFHLAHAIFAALMGVRVHQHLFRQSLPYDPLVSAVDLLLLDGAVASPK
ncbi:MAG: TetR/AcrR family transcriptional regulator [Myxococcaceae bacterium]|nr:TetR/AcrR family transcriptional regulator [Myxococcaceae bacterium]